MEKNSNFQTTIESCGSNSPGHCNLKVEPKYFVIHCKEEMGIMKYMQEMQLTSEKQQIRNEKQDKEMRKGK